MFGGIVETTGSIYQLSYANGNLYLQIKPHLDFTDLKIGDSVAINGVCLTVTAHNADFFSVTAVTETLQRTNLSLLKINDEINLERALKYGDRIGGHLMQGHIDYQGEIIKIISIGNDNKLISVAANTDYFIPKGFIAIDGMSLTLIDVTATHFTFTLIPHTYQVTIAKNYKVGTHVNLEIDMFSKYIEKHTRRYEHAKIY